MRNARTWLGGTESFPNREELRESAICGDYSVFPVPPDARIGPIHAAIWDLLRIVCEYYELNGGEGGFRTLGTLLR